MEHICSQSGNATSYQEWHTVQPPAWLQIQILNRNTIDWVHRIYAERTKDVKQSDVVVMDFTKAFDKVSHTRLLHKLHMYWIDPETCGWSRSFLCGRTQHVIVDREASEEVEITSGIQQGSVLGPIFFLIYINGMAEYTNTPQSDCLQMTPSYTSPSLQKMTAKNSKKTFKTRRGGRLTGWWSATLANALSS